MIGSGRLLLAFILALAGHVQGEAGVILELAGPAVAQVAMNRAAIGWDFDGWHAWVDPSKRATEIAWEAYGRGGDAEGNLFAISGADMARLGFDRANWRQVGSDRWPVWVGRIWE